jgi:putative Holliday junction resolvase
MAFDYGLRRIGVAVGQDITGSASPLGIIPNDDAERSLVRISALIREWQPSLLVVGLPLNTDGTSSTMTEAAQEFAERLAVFERRVEMTDERYSSREAEAALKNARSSGRRGRIQKEDVDAAAAVLIAERYLARD